MEKAAPNVFAKVEEQIRNAPPERRAELEKNLQKGKKEFEAQADLKDVRDAHGDAIVDAMLAEEPELRKAAEALAKMGRR